MPAHVGEALQFTVAAPHNNGGFARNIEDAKITRLWQLGFVTRKYPVAIDDLVEFKFIDRRVRIESLVKRKTRFLVGDQFVN